MKARHTWLTLVGMGLGLAGAYRLSRIYRANRAAGAAFTRRTYRSGRELVGAFEALWRHPADIWSLRANPDLSHPLIEKLMLAVSGATGARYGNSAQVHYARRCGLSPAAIDSLLRGEVGPATADEAPALFFVRHWVQTEGCPDIDLMQRLVDTYGPRTAHDIITCIRLFHLTAMVGNTADALLSRLLGRPSPESTLLGELETMGCFVFGVLPLVPVALLRGVAGVADYIS
jgi:hypothetical protein